MKDKLIYKAVNILLKIGVTYNGNVSPKGYYKPRHY